MTASAPLRLDIIQFILEDELIEEVPERKAGDLQDVARPYYFARASVVRIDKVTRETKAGRGPNQRQKRTRRRRAEVPEAVNAGRFVAQSQVRFELASDPTRHTKGP